MKRVIITGATGFVGANLTRRLLTDGHELHLLVRPGYTTWRIETVRPEVHVYEVDFGDAPALINIIKKIKPDWIFHLAAHGAYSWQTGMPQMVQTNIIGTINLVQACLETDFEAFVNTGSSSEYGFKKHAASENDRLEPNSHYAVTKASASMFCRYTAQSHNLHMPTLRLYSVYGPYEEPHRLLPTLIIHGLRNTLPPLVNPDVARDFVYVDDVCEAYLLAARRPGQEPGAIYNVGTGIQTSVREVVEKAQQIMAITTNPKWGSMVSRHWDTTVWLANNHKIQEKLGWQPHYTFEQGFRKMVAWFQETPLIKKQYRHLNQSDFAIKG